MRISNSSDRLGLRALVLASAMVSASACAPAPMDAGGANNGGSSGSGSGGSGGSAPSGSGGSAPSGSGGSAPSGSGGSAPSGSGGSGQGSGGMGARTGGTTGNPGTGGTTMMGTGGTTMPRPDAGGMETGGGADTMAPAGVTFTMVYTSIFGSMTCNGCHNMTRGGVNFSTKAMAHSTLMAKAGAVMPNMADNSNLVKLLLNMGTGTARRMPPAGNLLMAPQVDMVKAWINAGAKND
jgi:hypothetical protein